jgi:hypothetical protein
MRCLEEPTRLAHDHLVSPHNCYGETPSDTPNLDTCLKVEMLPPESTQGLSRQRPDALQEADPPDCQEH